MATLVNFLKIGSDGYQAENDPATDSIDLQNLQLTSVDIGSEGSGVDGPSVLNDDSTIYTYITPAGDTLRDTLLALDSYVGSISNAYDSDVYTNGEASPITIGQAVYISGNNTVMLADNDVNAKDDPIGLVKDASIAAAASGVIFTNGQAAGVLTGATAGTKYFLSDTAGALTTTVPTGSGKNVVFMGYAKNATDLFLRIQNIGKRV